MHILKFIAERCYNEQTVSNSNVNDVWACSDATLVGRDRVTRVPVDEDARTVIQLEAPENLLPATETGLGIADTRVAAIVQGLPTVGEFALAQPGHHNCENQAAC